MCIRDNYKARHGVHVAELRLVDIAERRALGDVELLALGTPCGTLDEPRGTRAPGSPEAVTLPVSELAASAPAAPPPEAPTQPPAARTPKPHGLGWFAWDGARLLRQPALLSELPAHTDRLLISFTQAQIDNLDRAALQNLQREAARQGVKLELLLGDPNWVKPDGRRQMVALLEKVAALPFDGLNLDLELSQLPPGSMSTPEWKRGAAETLKAARAAVPWRLALTTHYRDLDDAAFLTVLRQAGVDEVVPMIYSQSLERVQELMQRLLGHPAELRVALAQSVEAALPAEESSFQKGRRASVAQWRDQSGALAAHPRFSGVIVQSLEDYRKAKP